MSENNSWISLKKLVCGQKSCEWWLVHSCYLRHTCWDLFPANTNHTSSGQWCGIALVFVARVSADSGISLKFEVTNWSINPSEGMHLVSERERGIISVLILHRIWSVDCCQQFTAQLRQYLFSVDDLVHLSSSEVNIDRQAGRQQCTIQI